MRLMLGWGDRQWHCLEVVGIGHDDHDGTSNDTHEESKYGRLFALKSSR